MEIIGGLSVPVKIDLGPLEKEMTALKNRLTSVERELGRTTLQVEKLSKSSINLGRTFRSITPAIGGTVAAFLGFNQIVSTLANFESSMAAVKAITRASEEDFLALRDIAKDLGATTEFSASQAADGLKYLGMAGFSAQQSIAAIPDVLNLATAAQMDLAAASDISSNIMSAFGISADNAGSVADVLAAAASRANTDVYQLGNAMKYAGPVAKSLGISMSETAAAIGKLSDNGLQGSIAGTGLRTVMASLAKPTKEATKALESMGLKAADLNPKTNTLVQIIEKLSSKGIDASRAITIFGREGAAAILALTRESDNLAKLTDELGNVSGEAERMAKTMRDNLMGDLKGLASAVESVIIAFGDSGLTGALRLTVQGLTTVTRAIADLAGRIIAYGTALSVVWGVTYAAGILRAVSVTALLTRGLELLRAAMIRTGVGALVVVLGELIYQLIELRSRVDSWADAWSTLGDTFKYVTYAMRTSFLGATQYMAAAWGRFMSYVLESSRDVLSNFGVNIDIADQLKSLETSARQNMAGATIRFEDAADALGKAYEIFQNRPREMQGPPPPPGTPGGGGLPPDLDPFNSDGSGKKKRDPYEKLIEQSVRYVQQQNAERQAIGMTALEAAKLTKETDLLSQAQSMGIKLTDDQKDALIALSHSMAEAEYNTQKLQEAYDFGKDVFKGFFTDLKNDLQNGASLWEALGNAAANALQKIADKALDMALNGIFDMIFGAFGGGGGGGGLSGIISGLLGHATGTSYSPGGWRMVGENGPELMKVPGGAQVYANNRVTVPGVGAMSGGGSQSSQPRDINIYVTGANGDKEIREMVAQGVHSALETYDSEQLPASFERIRANPRMR